METRLVHFPQFHVHNSHGAGNWPEKCLVHVRVHQKSRHWKRSAQCECWYHQDHCSCASLLLSLLHSPPSLCIMFWNAGWSLRWPLLQWCGALVLPPTLSCGLTILWAAFYPWAKLCQESPFCPLQCSGWVSLGLPFLDSIDASGRALHSIGWEPRGSSPERLTNSLVELAPD